MNLFIDIQVDAQKLRGFEPHLIVASCPVDIFAVGNGRLLVQQENEDECVLCELCLQKAPPGAITIRKLYKDEILVSHGAGGAQKPHI